MLSGGISSWVRARRLAFVCAFRGLKVVAREVHFRVHIIFTALVLAMAWVCDLTHLEWALVFLVCGVVLSLEAVNSAIERIADFVSPEFHSAIGQIKDIAAAAVLIAAIVALIVGAFIFAPRLDRVLVGLFV
jgi:diacylglycerol kinase